MVKCHFVPRFYIFRINEKRDKIIDRLAQDLGKDFPWCFWIFSKKPSLIYVNRFYNFASSACKNFVAA